jgi:zinc protease
MKYTTFFLLLVLLASTSLSQPSKKILPFPIHQKQLSNGLNVVTVPFNSPGLAAFYIVVRAGSREEVEPGKTGFAHFFEHMMFRGTEKYPTAKYEDELKAIGAGANANTSLDRTIYHMTGNAEMLDKMFELEADRFQNLKYSVHDFKTEAGAVKGEYTKNSASPYVQLNEKVVSTAFDKHTYKHTTMGFFEDVVDMPNQYEYSKIFFDRFYRPEYSTIIVVGDVKADVVNKLAQKYFGNWNRGNYKPDIQTEPEQTATRFAHIKMAGFPPYLALNFKGPAFSHTSKELPALQLLNAIYFGETSELYQKLVVKERRSRTLGGGISPTRDPYLMSIGSSVVKQDDLQYVKDEIWKVLEQAKTTPVNARRLADTKSNFKYSFAMAQDSPDQIANSLAVYTYLTGNPETINTYYTLFDTITADDIMAAAKKYFVAEKMTVATIGSGDTGGVK